MATMIRLWMRNGTLRGVGGTLVTAMVALALFLALPAAAQAPELMLAVRKQFGYNMGSQIQGQFLLRATGPEDLAAVTFTLDGALLGEVSAAPFELTFQTGAYALGWHTLGATGVTAGGETVTADTLEFEFVPSTEAARGSMRILIPILLLVVGVMAVGALGSALSARKGGAAATDYNGVLGGAVCPKCGRPFGLHLWAPNLSLVGKLDRCPHCGKWSFVRRAPREVLEQAEAATAVSAPEVGAAGDAEAQRKKQLDDSRYVG